MNKLQRYKRIEFKRLNSYLNFMLKITIDELPFRKGTYNGYKTIKNKIRTTKKLPQKQYTTNLDVCNID